ncbi:hypothetical protein KAI04_05265 [Candidatus Pacearchaeota archaeon]|nr:hypothetical protein [Candidatus Pacearchaeota archaeon]
MNKEAQEAHDEKKEGNTRRYDWRKAPGSDTLYHVTNPRTDVTIAVVFSKEDAQEFVKALNA